MSWYHALATAFNALARRGREERQMDEEIQFHLEMEARRLVKENGLSEEEARYAAQRAFGGVEHHKDSVRDERGTSFIEDIAQDARFGLRTLRRRPGFTAIASLTLALGIGASTTLFGVVKAVLLTPLPYSRPEGIAVLWSSGKASIRRGSRTTSTRAGADIPAFANVGIFSDGAINLTENGSRTAFAPAYIDRDILPILGVKPTLGRGFTAEEDIPNGPRVVILGHDVWESRYSADPSVVGRSIQVNGQAALVVGVMPAGFRLPLDFGASGPTLIWLPLGADAVSDGAIPGPKFRQGGGNHGYYGLARLRAGATVAQANKQLADRVAQLGKEGVSEGAAVPSVCGGRRGSGDGTTQAGAARRVRRRRIRAAHRLRQRRGSPARPRRTAAARNGAARGARRGRSAAVASAPHRNRRARRNWRRVRRHLRGDRGLARTSQCACRPAPGGRGAAGSLGARIRVRDRRAGRVDRRIASGHAGLVHPPQTELRDGGRTATAGHTRPVGVRPRGGGSGARRVLVVGAGLMIRSVVNLFAIDAGIRAMASDDAALDAGCMVSDSVRVTAFHDELRRRARRCPA